MALFLYILHSCVLLAFGYILQSFVERLCFLFFFPMLLDAFKHGPCAQFIFSLGASHSLTQFLAL